MTSTTSTTETSDRPYIIGFFDNFVGNYHYVAWTWADTFKLAEPMSDLMKTGRRMEILDYIQPSKPVPYFDKAARVAQWRKVKEAEGYTIR